MPENQGKGERTSRKRGPRAEERGGNKPGAKQEPGASTPKKKKMTIPAADAGLAAANAQRSKKRREDLLYAVDVAREKFGAAAQH